MSDREKQILETFSKVIPTLSETGKEVLLAYGEGMAFKAGQQNDALQDSPPTATPPTDKKGA